MTTQTIKITDAVIKKALANSDIRQLKDPRYSLYFRINSNRTGGSWTLVHYQHGKQYRRKIGSYPQLTTKKLFDALPDIIQALAIDVKQPVHTDSLITLGQVLSWYLTRSETDRSISKVRKTNIKSMITKHLLPALNTVAVTAVDHGVIDSQLMWPLQQQLNISTVQAVFKVLKQATKQANRLKMIAHDPFAGVNFSDFIQAKINAKDGALRAEQLPLLAQQWQHHHDKSTVMLAVMMISCGTRIGETRMAKWTDIDVRRGEWFIPAVNTKTKQAHRLPLTPNMMALLEQYRTMSQSAFLFSNGNRKALSACKASEQIRTLSNGQWTAHDLRKLARTCWADNGVDYMVAEMLLNHALSKLDQAYIHTYAEQQKRQALVAYHEQLAQAGFFLSLDNSTNRLPITTDNINPVHPTPCLA